MKKPPDQRGRRAQSLGWHLHACKDHVYQDSCSDKRTDRECMACQIGAQRPIWQACRDPQPCCAGNTRLATKPEWVSYSLAGPGPWFLCRTCKRQHPFEVGAETPVVGIDGLVPVVALPVTMLGTDEEGR